MRDCYNSTEYVGTVRTCAVRGCFAGTRHDKPFCPKHVDHHEYAAQIIAVLEAREEDLERAAKGKLEVRSQLVREALHRLGGGTVLTVERLRRDLHLTAAQVDGLCKCLLRNRLAKKGRTARGKTTVFLQEAR